MLSLVAVGCGGVKPVNVDAAVTDAPIDSPEGTATVTVARTGTATGTVTSSTGGINCGTTCTAQVPTGTVMVLTAAADTGADFAGWSGACSGTSPSCSLTITADVTVEAAFNVARHDVTVALAGNGLGTVTASPGSLGLSCPGTCTVTVDYGTQVTLNAAPQTGSQFLGWSGVSCPGTGSCTFSVDGDKNINATFALNQSLVVTRSGTGSGTVTSSPAGINCGADCSETYPPGTTVVLTAAAASNSTFTGWSGGGCSGTGTCTVTVNAATTVDAQFTLRTYTLTVSKAGNGTGTVTSNPAGITCGADCSQVYNHGTTVTLTATPDPGITFAGWSGGGCSGSGSCVVTLTANTTVTATFNGGVVQPNYMFVTSMTTNGNIGGLAGADLICRNAAAGAGLGGSYVAWLSDSSTNAIDRLGTASGWIRVDGEPFANSQADLAAGKILSPPLIDEGGTARPFATAWTATRGNGTWITQDNACNNWTSTTPVGVTAGATLGVTDSWSAQTGNPCTSALRLFCFGVDRAATITYTAVSGRRMFMSAQSWTPGNGIGSADAVCASEAAAANLPGTFRALLATTTATAASRFSTNGATWVRTDGRPIVATASDLFAAGVGYYLNAPVVQANGTTYILSNPRRYVWSGANNMTSVGTNAQTCNDWTSSSANLMSQDSEVDTATPNNLFGGIGYLNCSQAQRLICMQL